MDDAVLAVVDWYLLLSVGVQNVRHVSVATVCVNDFQRCAAFGCSASKPCMEAYFE